MDFIIREMRETDREKVLSMMQVFYASDAVHTNGSADIFENDINYCLSDSPYLEGYVFQADGQTIGYSMLAKSFSTEFGKECIWIEDIYLLPEYRGRGFGSRFFDFIDKKYPNVIFRLEAEEENERAIHVYKKAGFQVMPYLEMKK